jgi:hypothetical protein
MEGGIGRSERMSAAERNGRRKWGWWVVAAVWMAGAAAVGNTMPPEAIRELAEQGDAGAQYRMGQMLLTGKGAEKDESQGVEWLRKAAGQGMADAQYRLSVCLRKGIGTERDDQEAKRWLEEAARNGNKTAAALTADPESREGMRLRARQGDRTAQRRLGEELLNIHDLILPRVLGKALQTGGSPEEVAEGLKWLELAAQRGDAEAATMLAWYHQERDEPKAFYWWNRAADLGSKDAQWEMVRRCRSGLGTRASESDAFRWCRKLAEGGDVRAMKEVGHCHEEGRGCIRDYGEAKRWYERGGDAMGVQRMENALRGGGSGGGTPPHFKGSDVRVHGPGALPGRVR